MFLIKEDKGIIVEKDLKDFLTKKNIDGEIKENDEEALKLFKNVVTDFFACFGIPVDDPDVSMGEPSPPRASGYYYNKSIVLCPVNIKDNNFLYIHALIHEATHFLQDFIITEKISRNNIDSITLNEYSEKCKDFFGAKAEVNEIMFKTFKEFIKTERFFENDTFSLMVTDHIKNLLSGDAHYFNNIKEIMADNFGIRFITGIVKELSLTESQCKKVRGCRNYNESRITATNKGSKKTLSLRQKLISIPFVRINFIYHKTKTQMNLSKIQRPVNEIMDDITYESSEDAKELTKYCIPKVSEEPPKLVKKEFEVTEITGIHKFLLIQGEKVNEFKEKMNEKKLKWQEAQKMKKEKKQEKIQENNQINNSEDKITENNAENKILENKTENIPENQNTENKTEDKNEEQNKEQQKVDISKMPVGNSVLEDNNCKMPSYDNEEKAEEKEENNNDTQQKSGDGNIGKDEDAI